MARKLKKNSRSIRAVLPARYKLRCAIATILGTTSAAHFMTATAADPGTGADRIEEVIVTAQRRTENVQNVPIAIQALSAETLTQLNVARLDDFVRYLPNVTAPSSGPGMSQVFMRGLSVGSDGVQSGGSISGFPNVAIYLDDQSGQLPSRNLDVYTADLERVEVLEGPQGTLFGAGAQAGVIRYITNKPKMNTVEANFNAGYATTAHGAQSSNIDATLNIPLIADHLAVRAVVYNENRGGYIDNIPGTFSRTPNEPGAAYQYHACPANCQSVNNNNLVAKDINPAYYKGIR